MRHGGYVMTESTGHLSEYLPWFRKNQQVLDLYCNEPSFGGESGAYYKYSLMIAQKFANTDVLAIETGELEPRSKEYCSYILEALETGNPFLFSGNVMNLVISPTCPIMPPLRCLSMLTERVCIHSQWAHFHRIWPQ